MKAQGIVVYTITFQLSNTTTQDLYRSSTTSPAHYFNSCSNNDLKNAFEENRQQADQLASRRIATPRKPED